MISGFDHAPIVVRDLDAAVARCSALFGRAPSWTGRLPGARHAWFQLANIALEVIAADGDGATGDNICRWFDAGHGEGPSAVGFATPAFDEARRMLARRGVPMAAVEEMRSKGDDGRERSLSYAMADIAATRGIQLFVVERNEPSPLASSPTLAEPEAAVAAIDHVVVRTTNPEASIALYGAKLDLDLRLDRSNPAWGSRLLFFRCGDAVVEVGASLNAAVSDDPDRLGGFAWRAPEPEAAHARMAAAGLDVSELRKGRKAGTSVFTVRDAIGGPNLIISASSASDD
jgi:catechol 2,3-dioxygenase-like lactoylglutathione lyase family enzyme